MPTFKNIKELEKYIGSEQGGNSLFSGTDSQIKRIMREEARRLQRLLKEEFQNYLDSYTPKEYERTGRTIDSIKVSEPSSLNGAWKIEVYWDDGLAYHDSKIDAETQPQGHAGWLIHSGWNIEEKVGFSIPMFTQHPGSGYITKAIDRFNKTNKYGMKIQLDSKWL